MRRWTSTVTISIILKHPFYGDVEGDSMKDTGIFDGDRVINFDHYDMMQDAIKVYNRHKE